MVLIMVFMFPGGIVDAEISFIGGYHYTISFQLNYSYVCQGRGATEQLGTVSL